MDDLSCFFVSIFDDGESEPDEKFQLLVSVAPEPIFVQVEIFRNTSEFIILDNDRELSKK